MMKTYSLKFQNNNKHEVLADKFTWQDGQVTFFRLVLETGQYEVSAVFTSVSSVEEL